VLFIVTNFQLEPTLRISVNKKKNSSTRKQATAIDSPRSRRKERTNTMADQPPAEQPSNQPGSSKATADPSDPQPSTSSTGKEAASEDVKMDAEPEVKNPPSC
jgi:hypothetical protein